jgi:hypothetical protein
MNASVVSTITTALWILIEAIQFAYMAYLMWLRRNDVTSRHTVRSRAAFAGA